MKKKWKKDKNKYYSIIFQDLLQNKPIKRIHKDLLDSTINHNKRNFAYAVKVADKIYNKQKGKPEAEVIFFWFGKFNVFDLSLKNINRTLREEQNQSKGKILEDEIKENRQKETIPTPKELGKPSIPTGEKEEEIIPTGKYFYVCSKHSDSAKDHKDYQGKTYVDIEGFNYPQIKEYADKHHLKTLQWVTGAPVWLVTRPHCRHYFTAYSLAEISQATPNKYPIGPKFNQTPARASLEYWLDRLEFLEGLRPRTKEITLQIEKAKLLIKKWRQEI